MKFDPEIHRRRSTRLKGHDYTQPGPYFITICTQGRQCLFGEVVDGEMRLNAAGRMIQTTWHEIPNHYPGVDVDSFVVMPNHIHGIIVLVGAGPCACPDLDSRTCPDESGQPQGVAPTGSKPRRVARTLSLPDVVHRFKTLTTKRYVDGVKNQGWAPFPGRLWQRNYYEHIIRDDQEWNRIQEYISQNPLKWSLDRENPNVRTTGRSP